MIVATNLGPSGVTGASVVDTMPNKLSGVSWTCVGAGGGTCTAASGSGNINTTVNLPLNATATFTVNANIIAGTGGSSVTNTATIAVPASVTDSYPNNNGAADTDFIGELRTVTVTKLGIGQGTLVSVPSAISCGTSCTFAQGNFVEGQQIVLSVNPLPGHTFEGWGGDCAFAGTSNCSITVTGNMSITATISKPTVVNGTDCTLNAECTSGICVDGVCCNTSCGGGANDCQACNLAGKRGVCSLLNLQGVADGNVCDGADNDCDGGTDEDYQPLTTHCGVGFCARNGQTTCNAGQVGDTCQAGQPSAGGEVCDGVDNDCDGLLDGADNTLVLVPCNKNTGVCAGLMKTASMCVNGSWQACPDAYYASNLFPNYSLNDNCDAKDNDCDGTTDEDYATVATTCGTGSCARTGQRSCTGGTVVDTCVAGQAGGSDTSCDGADNNCNGQTDEGYQAPVTNCGTGACARTGFAFCVQGGVVNSCSAGQAAADDANCNGIDDNCNGQTDEGFVPSPTSCGVGVCARNGQTTCNGGVLGNTCQAGQAEPGGEVCDGKDNDCDGLTDGADPSMASVSCEKQAGVCAGTTKPASLCVSGAWQACSDATYTAQRFPNYATSDTCDNKDNDCDGVTDENFAPSATSCGTGVCVRAGQTTCTAGMVGDNCQAGQPEAGGEICDNKDNDCDGLTDAQDPSLGLVACEKQAGVCSGTLKPAALCINGGWGVCTDAIYSAQRFPNYATSDACDNKDNDCDGVTDENFVAANTSCGQGVCERTGRTTCTAGTLGDTCQAGNPNPLGEICDGLDNDCDGLTDALDSSMTTIACEKQTGVCAAR